MTSINNLFTIVNRIVNKSINKYVNKHNIMRIRRGGRGGNNYRIDKLTISKLIQCHVSILGGLSLHHRVHLGSK